MIKLKETKEKGKQKRVNTEGSLASKKKRSPQGTSQDYLPQELLLAKAMDELLTNLTLHL